MKLVASAIVLSSLFAKSWTSRLAAPLDYYKVIIPQWEVEVSPAGSTVILNGTIEEVREELLKLNPAWDTDYPTHRSRLAKRYDFSKAMYFCRGRWPECPVDRILEGIDYLRGVSGQPVNGPGPGNCGRVSCSYDSAIWWCNDNAEPKQLSAFSDIADGAEFIVDKCGYDGTASGQAFTPSLWNVIVRKDDC